MSDADEFVKVLAQLRDGTFLLDAGEGLAELVEQVRQTGRAGRLMITFDVKAAGKGVSGMVVIRDALVVKLPKAETSETVMYALEGGQLSRRDPRQPMLPLQEVE